MAFLTFNKSELVNLSYSLKREIISANKTGAYCNTSIVTCNTRRYHGLLAVPVDRFGKGKYVLLSALDESLVLNGKQFNLGIHCYGDVYEPRGHKYIVDFDLDPVPVITYKVGEILFKKSIILAPDNSLRSGTSTASPARTRRPTPSTRRWKAGCLSGCMTDSLTSICRLAGSPLSVTCLTGTTA